MGRIGKETLAPAGSGRDKDHGAVHMVVSERLALSEGVTHAPRVGRGRLAGRAIPT